VAAGRYNLTSMLHYGANDGDGSLTIVAEDPNNRPVLDGQGNTIIFNIDNDQNGDETGDDGNVITIRYLIFQRGYNSLAHGFNGRGGGLSIHVGAADVHIENCIFQNNVADYEGGGAWILSKSGDLTMSNNEFTNNRAGLKGGGFVFSSSYFPGSQTWGSGSATISGNTFNSNRVTSSFAAGGGGFFAMSGRGGFTVTNNDFQNNYSFQKGGGALFGSGGRQPITITGNTFRGNVAEVDLGGGLATGFHGGNSTITVSNNVFLNNSSRDYKGGGLSLRLLTNIQGIPSTGTANITNNVFVNNSSGDNGGGLKLTSSSGTLNVTNNTFYGNQAGGFGGGVQAKLEDNNATLNVFNNIIFANTSGSGGDDVYVNSDGGNFQGDGIGSPVALFNNDIGPNNNNFSGSSEDLVISDTDHYTQGNNIDTDPQLRSPSSGDAHLLSTSPCIDTGTNSAPAIPSFDIDNQQRIMDGNNDGTAVVDMGADEAGASVATVPTMNQWGLMVFSLLMGMAAFYSFKMNKLNI